MLINKNNGLYEIAKKNNTLMYATIELLTACNWQCKHCYIPKHNSAGLSLNTLINIFDQLRELNTFEITFTGGEMFLREDIMNILETARMKGFNLQLFTNVSLLNEDIVNKLKELYIDKVSCTIYSLNPEIHDEITGIKGSLDKALKNILMLRKANIPVEIKTILFHINYSDYKSIHAFCEQNNIHFLATANVFPKTNGALEPLEMAVTKDDLEAVLNDIDTIRGYGKRNIGSNTHMCCESIEYSIAIDCNGDVYPCNNLHIKIGNVLSTKISEIWTSSTELRKLRNIRYKDLTYCSKCKQRDYCYRCAGTVQLEEGSVFGKCKLECMHAQVRMKSIT